MSDFSEVKALIVDDDTTSINVLKRLLAHLSINCYVIQDNEHIDSDLEELPLPDVIFLDLEMPSQDGYTVLELFKHTPDFNMPPIVAYTAHTSHLKDAREAGFHSFLSKPLNHQEFPDQLARILR